INITPSTHTYTLSLHDALPISIDTIYTDFKDPAGLKAECAAAKRSGFAAKMAIHPAQLATINEAFSVSAEEREWAERVIAAFARSEEHTSELQSRFDLVCRLLL